MQCRHREICKNSFHVQTADECSHEKSWECPIADKIEDILMDTPFCEPYDGPVEEEEV
jgi:hypothetical protein